MLGVIGYPLGLAIWYSLTDASIGEPGSFVGLEQYRFLVRDPAYRSAVAHTATYAGLSTVLKLVFGTAVAIALHRPFRGRGLLTAVLLLPLLFPVVMAGIAWYFLLSDVRGAVNYVLLAAGLIREEYAFLGSAVPAMLSLVLINVWHGTPIVTMLALAGLRSLPGEILDAARVDGAGALARFLHVQLPALVPGLALAALLSLLGTFGDYAIIHLVTAGGPGGETHIVSSLAFAEALRNGELSTGIATALSIVPANLAALAVAAYLIRR